MAYRSQIYYRNNTVKTIKSCLSICLLLTITAAMSEQPQQLKPFSSESIKLIKQQHSHHPYILLLWSIDCPPCYTELQQIGNSDQSLIDFIIITTDDISRAKEAEEILNEFKISSKSQWIFANESKEKLTYSIDPQWRGELPRSYLYNGNELKDSHSGILTNDKLKEWIQKNDNSTSKKSIKYARASSPKL